MVNPPGEDELAKSVILTGPRQFEIVRERVGPPDRTSVLLRVTRTGICSGDLDRWRLGAPPVPVRLGHEVEGVVCALGEDAPRDLLGRRVTAWVPGGGYAQYVSAESEHVVPLVPGVDGVLVEPLACCLNAWSCLPAAGGETAVVVGAGFMGELMTRLLDMSWFTQVVQVGRGPSERRHPAGARTGTGTVGEESAREVVGQATGGRGADVVVELTGTQSGLDLAGSLVRREGTLVIGGYHQDGRRSVDLGGWNYEAIRIVNGHFRDPKRVLAAMRWAAKLLAHSSVGHGDLFTHCLSLDDMNAGFEKLGGLRGNYRKGVLAVRDEPADPLP
ncbi:alcohol dehydrogenase catalytic domain-containing protein [Amycolatopsis balhimycina]|uniref:alcohol dehydrogenase catalytic domain-containing protein n=1 Tax=Amycolatopsis balhimycina TaxID=208443 RepID=UPI000367BC7A|nr:alcohol dehydrogenase catalytic domain-containing protein [Amycolatopsis balhimycina]